jgi:thiamine-monophosphate kinase
LVITWHIIGIVPSGCALRRDSAVAGDAIYVSGTLGAAAAALELLPTKSEEQSEFQKELLERYWYPRPRFELAQKIRGIASSCIDISDGLVADLTHIARSSRCGAVVEFAKIPISNALLESTGPEDARRIAATGGDDYELCFTVPPEREAALLKMAVELEFSVTRVGTMVDGSDVCVLDDSGATIDLKSRGYRHFD